MTILDEMKNIYIEQTKTDPNSPGLRDNAFVLCFEYLAEIIERQQREISELKKHPIDIQKLETPGDYVITLDATEINIEDILSIEKVMPEVRILIVRKK